MVAKTVMTDEQKRAIRPWAMAAGLVYGAEILSWGVMIFLLLSGKLERRLMAIWFATTVISTHTVTLWCSSRVNRLLGESAPSKGFPWRNFVTHTLLTGLLAWYFWRGG